MSHHPDFATFLVEAGIDSISLNPDSVVENRYVRDGQVVGFHFAIYDAAADTRIVTDVGWAAQLSAALRQPVDLPLDLEKAREVLD